MLKPSMRTIWALIRWTAKKTRRSPQPLMTHRASMRKAKRACKPGSVEDDHLSWHMRYRTALRTLPGCRSGQPIAPLFALAPDGVYPAVASPRRWWSLTPPFQLFPLCAKAAHRWESSFLRHFPSDRSAWPLASILPYGARTFLTRTEDPARRAAVRPASREVL